MQARLDHHGHDHTEPRHHRHHHQLHRQYSRAGSETGSTSSKRAKRLVGVYSIPQINVPIDEEGFPQNPDETKIQVVSKETSTECEKCDKEKKKFTIGKGKTSCDKCQSHEHKKP